MSSFTDPLTVTKEKGGFWTVEREFEYRIGGENSTLFVRVPKGFETDFASVPRPFWAIFPPDGQYSQAAVVHDYLYHTQKILHKLTNSDESYMDVQRRFVDKIFLEAMGVLGVNWLVRNTMYRAVRLGGWIPWNKRAKELKK